MKKKTVALVGLAANTRPYCAQSSADEFWTLNAGWEFTEWGIEYLKAHYPDLEIKSSPDIPRVDRLFDMHTKEYLSDPNYLEPHQWPFLCDGEKPFPIYMPEAYPEVLSSIAYPYPTMTQAVFGNVFRGGKINPYWTSGFPYMVALAVHEGFDAIEIYGFEMQMDTEYDYQMPGAAFLLGWAAAKGVKIHLHPESYLLRSLVYGYEGAQMIPRGTLEVQLRHYQDEYEKRKIVANAAFAIFQEHSKNGASDVEIQSAFNEFLTAYGQAERYFGAVQVVEKQIEFCDLREPDLDLKRGLVQVELESEVKNGDID